MLERESAILKGMGFQRETNAFRLMWPTGDRNEQYVITIAKLEKGWSFIWQRGVGYTIAEESRATFEEIIAAFWRCIFNRSEDYLRLLREHAMLVTKQDGR